MIRPVLALALALTCSPAFADGFTAVHEANQKLGSPVVAYWTDFAAHRGAEDYAAVHADNQKIGSTVAAFWTAYAKGAAVGLEVDAEPGRLTLLAGN